MNKHRWQSFAKFKKIQGIEAIVFASVLLFLPVNLAKHFFFDFCYVDGILVDYLIPTVYLTDILIWGLVGIWGFRGFRGKSFILYSSFFCHRPIVLWTIILVSGLSVFSAANQPAAVYKWLKLVEYVLAAFYVSRNIDLKKDWSTIVKILSIGVLFESLLAIAQWFKQGSIFGFWFFGENKYTISTPGIATFDFFGVKKVRPYGTFPHPNVLGGYLAVLLPWMFYVLVRKMQKNTERLVTSYWLLVTSCSAAALFLSFGRSAWVVGLLGVLVFRFKGFPSSILLSLSFLRRAELNWIALQIIKKHPFLGVGLNNFTVRMSEYGEVSGWARFLQPVHNVYLLIAAEIGLIGLGLFFCLLFSVFRLLLKKRNHLLLVSMSQVALLCFIDHYFFTLQQTSILFWLLVGLAFSAAEEKP